MKRKPTWAAAIIAAAAGLLVLVYILRGVPITPHLTARVRETVREHLGLEISIGQVAGSLLADLEIRDVQTVTPAVEGPVSFLALKRLGLRYSLMSLRHGFAGFVQAASIDVEDRRILTVTVEEMPSPEVFFGPGYGSYEQLRLVAGYRLKNFFGTGRSWTLVALGAEKAQALSSTRIGMRIALGCTLAWGWRFRALRTPACRRRPLVALLSPAPLLSPSPCLWPCPSSGAYPAA